ncbi:Protein of unknown function [Gryllus bimaculatus]|nr:Protein of unknown function [Gryllus bimaculatus]
MGVDDRGKTPEDDGRLPPASTDTLCVCEPNGCALCVRAPQHCIVDMPLQVYREAMRQVRSTSSAPESPPPSYEDVAPAVDSTHAPPQYEPVGEPSSTHDQRVSPPPPPPLLPIMRLRRVSDIEW